jgi:hypothetical protein
VSQVRFGATAAPFTLYDEETGRAEVPVGGTSGPLTLVHPAGNFPTAVSFTVGEIDTATSGFIHLAWDNCQSTGSDIQAFACNTNSGTPFTLVASFIPPIGNPVIVGYEGKIRISSASALPDWWKHGIGQCRGTLHLSTATHMISPWPCINAFQQGIPYATYSYQVGYDGPNTALFRFSASYPDSMAFMLNSANEYYAYLLTIWRYGTVGAGACAGCDVPVGVELQSLRLYHPAGGPEDRAMTRTRDGRAAFWQSPTPPAPLIGSFNPPGGAPGTVVTLHGSGFATTQQVSFTGGLATFSVVSDAQLTAVVPAAARTGPITVLNAIASNQSAEPFVLAPILQTFAPQQAPVGHLVRIYGRNLNPTDKVLFYTTPATSVHVHNDTLVDANVPAGATSGPITVQNAGGSSTSSASFIVGPLTGVDDSPVTALELSAAMPNPSSRAVRWSLALPHGVRVRAAIHDAAGARVRALASGPFDAGRHDLMWDGRNERGARVRPGRYFIIVEAGGSTLRGSLVRLR